MSQIRICILIVILGLAISGLTAFPIQAELKWLVGYNSAFPEKGSRWLLTVYNAIANTNARYPWLSYGTDWLAFAHLLLAILFYGPIKDPVRNVWVIEFGMIACISIFPLALIAGPIRQIPLFWRFIDCSFGLIGIIPLLVCYKNISKLQAMKKPVIDEAYI